MRTFITLILSVGSVLAADVRVVTTAKTNAETASVYRTDVYTRSGQTNLVRHTKTKDGASQAQIHRFYYGGVMVADYKIIQNSSGLSTEAGSPYSVTFEFWPSKDVRSAVIGTKDGVILDAFMATNGVFYPADISTIRKANEVGEGLSKLLSPSNVTNTSPRDFRREVDQFIRKHQDK